MLRIVRFYVKDVCADTFMEILKNVDVTEYDRVFTTLLVKDFHCLVYIVVWKRFYLG